jgi:hypothetical protein
MIETSGFSQLVEFRMHGCVLAPPVRLEQDEQGHSTGWHDGAIQLPNAGIARSGAIRESPDHRASLAGDRS